MKEVIGLAALIVILIIYDRWYRQDIEDWIDDHLRNSPHRKSMTKMLQSMGSPTDFDPVEFVASPRNRLLSRVPIWIILAMLVMGLLIRLYDLATN